MCEHFNMTAGPGSCAAPLPSVWLWLLPLNAAPVLENFTYA